ncbi:MAG: enoyl-CoA hydratase-related protein [Dehalococcoidia bacterium]|nr:enoyl-CoA hydratase-related protein [Dehalococcoidia bacterium]
MARDIVLIEKSDGVAKLTLNQPETLNVFNTELMEATFDALEELRVDSQTRVAIIAGAGRAFSGGADIKGRFLENIEKRKRGELNIALRESTIKRGLDTIVNFGKPIIAAVNGFAVGLGCTLSLACDMRVASEDARFGFGFVKMAVTPEFGSSYFLPRLIGSGRAFELIYTGRLVDAKEAKEIGLINMVVPSDQLGQAALLMAMELAEGQAVSIRLIREGIQQGMQVDLETAVRWEQFALNTCFTTDDHEEAVHAFIEKRKPSFKGR